MLLASFETGRYNKKHARAEVSRHGTNDEEGGTRACVAGADEDEVEREASRDREKRTKKKSWNGRWCARWMGGAMKGARRGVET